MIRETVVRFEQPEREAFKTACNWTQDEDADPATAGPLLRLMSRDGRPYTMDEIERAHRELRRTLNRVRDNSLVGLPAGLVAPGTDLTEISDDIRAVATREITPAVTYLRQALGYDR